MRGLTRRVKLTFHTGVLSCKLNDVVSKKHFGEEWYSRVASKEIVARYHATLATFLAQQAPVAIIETNHTEGQRVHNLGVPIWRVINGKQANFETMAVLYWLWCGAMDWCGIFGTRYGVDRRTLRCWLDH